MVDAHDDTMTDSLIVIRTKREDLKEKILSNSVDWSVK